MPEEQCQCGRPMLRKNKADTAEDEQNVAKILTKIPKDFGPVHCHDVQGRGPGPGPCRGVCTGWLGPRGGPGRGPPGGALNNA